MVIKLVIKLFPPLKNSRSAPAVQYKRDINGVYRVAEWCNMFHLLLLNTNNLVIGQHECIKEWLKDESA